MVLRFRARGKVEYLERRVFFTLRPLLEKKAVPGVEVNVINRLLGAAGIDERFIIGVRPPMVQVAGAGVIDDKT